MLDAIWECLLPGLDQTGSTRDDEILADRLRRLSFAPVPGSAARSRPGAARIDVSAEGSALPGGTAVVVEGSAEGSALPGGTAVAVDASAGGSALPHGTLVAVDPVEGGWQVKFGSSIKVAVGHGDWRESSPLGRPVVAAGAWQGDTFVADLYVITTPHRVRLVVDAAAGTAVATWNKVPLTGPSLVRQLRSPLMTRPDVA